MRIELTEKMINQFIVQAPGIRPTENSPGGQWVADICVPGFHVRIWPTGHASYVVKKRMGRRVLTRTIGPVQHIGLEEARIQAVHILKQLEEGIDPLEEKRDKHTQMTDVLATRGVQITIFDALRAEDKLKRIRSPSLKRLEALGVEVP